MRRRTSAVVVGVPMALPAALPAAWAGQASPHFVGTPVCSKTSAGLTCSGKATGLDGLVTSAFLTATRVVATWECVNRGGNVAPGQPTVTEALTGPVQTITPHNGNITFNVSLPAPPKPKASVVCPNPNWSVRMTSLSFYGVVLHLQQNGGDILSWTNGDV